MQKTRRYLLRRDQAEAARTRYYEIMEKRDAGKFGEITGDEHAILYLSESVLEWHKRWNKIRRKKQVVVMSDECRGLLDDYRVVADRLNRTRFVLMEFDCPDAKDPDAIRKWLQELTERAEVPQHE